MGDLASLTEVFGPVVGSVVGLLMVPAIIILWRQNIALSKKNDEDNREWRDLFLKYSNESLNFTKTLAKTVEDDISPRTQFREKVLDHQTKQEVFRSEVIRRLDG